MVWTNEERKQLQRVENRVSSQILGAPIYTPVAALHGVIGASSVEGRDMKMKLSMKAMVLEYLLVQVSSISCNHRVVSYREFIAPENYALNYLS